MNIYRLTHRKPDWDSWAEIVVVDVSELDARRRARELVAESMGDYGNDSEWMNPQVVVCDVVAIDKPAIIFKDWRNG